MNRYALLIGNSDYDDERLARLNAPPVDVRALADLLRDPAIGRFEADAVTELINPSFPQARTAIVDFFSAKKHGDLLLLYFSGHGIVDFDNRLYLAVRDTRYASPRAAGIDSDFIKNEMNACRARQQVFLLDCCFSGAFTHGIKSVGIGTQAITTETFASQGKGQVILTASDSTQYAWDGEAVQGGGQNSLFTRFVVEGLKTGAADHDRDGVVTPENLYDYIFEQITAVKPDQKPQFTGHRQGEMALAYNPYVLSASPLPLDLLKACKPDQPLVTRVGAVSLLAGYLQDANPAVAQAAGEQLEILARDDSNTVSTAARRALEGEKARLEGELKRQRRDGQKQVHQEAESKGETEAERRQDEEIESQRKAAQSAAVVEAPEDQRRTQEAHQQNEYRSLYARKTLAATTLPVGAKRPSATGLQLRTLWLAGGIGGLFILIVLFGWLFGSRGPLGGLRTTPIAIITPTRLPIHTPTNAPTRLPIHTPTNAPTHTITLTPTISPTPDRTVALPAIITDTNGVPMALIPAGPFQMGSESSTVYEMPVHTVTLDAFNMDVYEVTNARYAGCVSAGECSAPAGSQSSTRSRHYGNSEFDDYPVINVNWKDAEAYCAWRGGRLPSEAEWEKAARGGLNGVTYTWGDDAPVCTPGALNGAHSGDCIPQDTLAVGSFSPNGYGLYDMAGNVWEWTNDWWEADYYGVSPGSNPPGPETGTTKVLRGGGWNELQYYLRVTFRTNYYPVSLSEAWGFRCAALPGR